MILMIYWQVSIIPIETGNQQEHCIYLSAFQQLQIYLPLQHNGLGRILPTVVSTI